MFRNYVKIALRNLIRDKLYTMISVVGLSIGIACCLLIFLYVQDELSFDRFHEKARSIYRLIHVEEEGLQEAPEGTIAVSIPTGPELKASVPEIVDAVRLDGGQQTIRYKEKSFTESVTMVDPGFFKMFSFPLVYGDPNTVLDDPGGIVISEEMAAKYFGEDDPIGETFTILFGETAVDVAVAGVVKDAPTNSSIQLSFVGSSELFKYAFPAWQLDSWDIIVIQTFVELLPGTNPAEVEKKIASHMESLLAGTGADPRYYRLQPLLEVHLDPRYEGLSINSSDPLYSYILSAIAAAVLIIACINFMSLAIGRSSGRAREVGLRKVLGAQRRQLIWQYWGEAFWLSVMALFLGFVLAEVFLPAFNKLAEKELSIALFSDWSLPLAMVGLILFISFAAGIYPGLVLSNLIPVEIFRGKMKLGGKSRLVQGLVVLQFAISILLIICTFVISSQMRYVGTYDLGYEQNLVVTFPTGSQGEESANLLSRFKNELSGNGTVVDITGYSYPFGSSWLYLNYGGEGFKVLIGEDITGPGYTEDPEVGDKYFYMNWVDAHFIPTMGIELKEGRNFADDRPADQDGAIILNETAVRQFGWDNPIGQHLPKGFRDAQVIGVVEDFHFYPLHRELQPLILHMPRTDELSSIFQIAVRIRPDDISGTLASLEKIWSSVSEGRPFEYRFLDERIAEQYEAEQRWRRIVEYSSIFAILIASIGLFGLTSLAVSKRTREVGIRKVLGASVARIVTLLTSDFAVLVIIANLIAWPVAYLVMNRWLQDFTYKMDLSIWIFLVAGTTATMIAVMTVSFQAIKAALTDPVKSLRYE